MSADATDWQDKYHRLDERFMEVARLASQATRERDALRAALRSIADLPNEPHDAIRAINRARAALAGARP